MNTNVSVGSSAFKPATSLLCLSKLSHAGSDSDTDEDYVARDMLSKVCEQARMCRVCLLERACMHA